MIQAKKHSEEYLLHDGDFKLQVKVYHDVDGHGAKKLKITDTEGCREFVFDRSKPETVKKIGELLIEASKL